MSVIQRFYCTYKKFCRHRPFSTLVDRIFALFPKFVESCFCILYLASVTWFAVGYAAFAAHDRDPSSNVNEVIKTILDFFIQKFYKHKAQNANKQTRIKNALKNIWGEKSPLFAYLLLWFCSFAGLCLCAFGAFCAKSFRKKEFKIALIASFMLLLVWFYQTVVKFVCFIFTFFFW